MPGRGMRPWTWGLLSKQHCAQAAVQRYVGRMVRCVGPCTSGSAFTQPRFRGRGDDSELRGALFRLGVYDGEVASQEEISIDLSAHLGGQGLRGLARYDPGRRYVRIGGVLSGRVPA